MGKLRLALLGSPQIVVDGEEKILRERKAMAMLAYLAVERSAQSRDTLATLLWPESDQTRARANLRYLLWSLRKALGGDWLITNGDQILLAVGDDVRVDVAAFQEHLSLWRAHSHSTDEYCDACVVSLEAALQLYRDDFLQGFSLTDSPQFDDWQFFQAEGLRQALAEALKALVALGIARKGYEAAIGHARRWLALDPIHEPATRALMKLYTWTDQYEAAIRQFHRCALALREEIGVEPDAETTELYAQIRNRRFPQPFQKDPETDPDEIASATVVSLPAGNLPPASNYFVGRQTELAQIAVHLADPTARLLTIVGPGGMGKSTLALQAGRAEAGRFPDGVWLVSLSGLESPEQAPVAILKALGAPNEGSSARQQLLRYLSSKKCLLILDNFEDVLPAAELVAELLHTCPPINMLVTTRERLNLREEWLLSLGTLTYPADTTIPMEGLVSSYSALHLFALCVQRLQPSFALDQATLAPVIRICHLVDGMPLALEMAAAWVRVLPIAQIPAEIEKSITFLASPARNVAERHRSIHAVFDSAWQLLPERERSVLRQLSVFRNGFIREAAEAVADASLLELSALLDKSWIRLTSDGRYRMHALAHQYAREKLHGETGEPAGEILRRHCLFYAAMAPTKRSVEVSLPAAEVENLRLAWDTALTQRNWTALRQIDESNYVMRDGQGIPGLLPHIERTVIQVHAILESVPPEEEEEKERIAIQTVLVKMLYVLGENQIDLSGIQRAIPRTFRNRSLLESHQNGEHPANIACAHLFSLLGFARYATGQFAKAEAFYQEALTAYQAIEHHPGVANTYMYLAMAYDRLGRYNDAEEVIRLTSRFLDRFHWDQGMSRSLGRVLTKQGRYPESRSILENALAVSEYNYQSHVLLFLGPVARGQGQPEEAMTILHQGLSIACETGDLPAQSDLLLELGLTTVQTGEVKVARDYFSRSLIIARKIGRLRTVPLALMGLGRVEILGKHWVNARSYLAEALSAEADMQAPPDVLDILVSIGELYVAEGKQVEARELLYLACQHPATTHETRTHSQQILRSLDVEPPTLDEQLPWETAQTSLDEIVHATQGELDRKMMSGPVSPART